MCLVGGVLASLVSSDNGEGRSGSEELNRSIWNRETIVGNYLSAKGLQKPERTIIDELKLKGRVQRVLDIGVGTGRTTEYLVELGEEYVGVDYSYAMLRECCRKTRGQTKVQLVGSDARCLPFKDEVFGLVFFSFNGIDYLSDGGRMTALTEAFRVLEADGTFVFSTHNLRSFTKLPSLRSGRALTELAYAIRTVALRLLLNRRLSQKLRGSWAYLRDGTEDLAMVTYYVAPEAQVEALREVGFGKIRVFSADSGEELNGEQMLSAVDDWLYFMCNREGRLA